MNTSLLSQVVEQLETLPENLQWRVLEFVHTLKSLTLTGTPGSRLIQLAGGISPDDLQTMSQVIEAGCERVDADGW